MALPQMPYETAQEVIIRRAYNQIGAEISKKLTAGSAVR